MEGTTELEKQSLDLGKEISPFKNLESTKTEGGDFKYSVPLFGIGLITFMATKGALDDPNLYELSCIINLKDRLNQSQKVRWQEYLGITLISPTHKILFSYPNIEDGKNDSKIVFNTWSSNAQMKEHEARKTAAAAPNPYTAFDSELPNITFFVDNLHAQKQKIIRTMKS